MEFSSWLVALVGILVVFTGLLSLVVVCYILGAFAGKIKDEPAETASAQTAQAETPEEHGKLVAAVAAAIAEHEGRDIAGIRIHSIKKIG